MVDDMTTSNGGFDTIAQWARLSERVENQGKDIVDLRSNMNTGFSNVQSALNALTNEFRGSSKTQWPVIISATGVALTIIIAVGTLTIAPIRESVAKNETGLSALREVSVDRQEMDWRTARSAEDRQRTDGAILELRTNTVTRNEWTERNRARDQEMSDVNRRVDELRQDVGSVYGTRDVIIDLKKELDTLRQRIASMRATAPPGM